MNLNKNRNKVLIENIFSITKISNNELSHNHCHNDHNVLSCSEGLLNIRDSFRQQQSSCNRKRAGQEHERISITNKKKCHFNCKDTEIIKDVKQSSLSFDDFDFSDSESSKILKNSETSYESFIVETTRTKYYHVNNNDEGNFGNNLGLGSICGKCKRRKTKKEKEWSILPIERLQNEKQFKLKALNEIESEINSEDSFTIIQEGRSLSNCGKNLKEIVNSNQLFELNALTEAGSEIYSEDSFTIDSITDDFVKDKKPNILKSFSTKKLQFRIDSSTFSETDNLDMDSKSEKKYSKNTFDSYSSSTCSLKYSQTDDLLKSNDNLNTEISSSTDSVKSQNNLGTEYLSETEPTKSDLKRSNTALKIFFYRKPTLTSKSEHGRSNVLERSIIDTGKSSRKLINTVTFNSAPNLRVKLKIPSYNNLNKYASDTNSISKETNFESFSKVYSGNSQTETNSLTEVSIIGPKYSNDDTDVDDSISNIILLEPSTSDMPLHKSESAINKPNFANKKSQKYDSPIKIEIECFRKPYFSQIIYNTNYQPKEVIFDHVDTSSQDTLRKRLNECETDSKVNRKDSSSRAHQIKISFTKNIDKQTLSKDHKVLSKNSNLYSETVKKNSPSGVQQENFTFSQVPEESDVKTKELEIVSRFSQVIHNESNKSLMLKNFNLPSSIKNLSNNSSEFNEQIWKDDFTISVDTDLMDHNLPVLSISDVILPGITDFIEQAQLSDADDLFDVQLGDIPEIWNDDKFSDLLYIDKTESGKKIQDANEQFKVDDADSTSENIKLLCPELSNSNSKIFDNLVDSVKIDSCRTVTSCTSVAICKTSQTNIVNPIQDLNERLTINVRQVPNVSQLYENNIVRNTKDLTILKSANYSLSLQGTQQLSLQSPNNKEKSEYAIIPQREKIVHLKSDEVNLPQCTSPAQRVINLDESENKSETGNVPTEKEICDSMKDTSGDKLLGSFTGEKAKCKITRNSSEERNECVKDKSKHKEKGKIYNDKKQSEETFSNLDIDNKAENMKYEKNLKLDEVNEEIPQRKKHLHQQKKNKKSENIINLQESDELTKYKKEEHLDDKINFQIKDLYHHIKLSKESLNDENLNYKSMNSQVSVLDESNIHRLKYYEKEKSKESKTKLVDFKDGKILSNSVQSKVKKTRKYQTYASNSENFEKTKNDIDKDKLKIKAYASQIIEIGRIDWESKCKFKFDEDKSQLSKIKNDLDDEWCDTCNEDYKRDKNSEHKHKIKQKLVKYNDKTDKRTNQRPKKNKYKKKESRINGASSTMTQAGKLPIAIGELENRIPGIMGCLGNIKLTGLETPVPGLGKLSKTYSGLKDLFDENIARFDVIDFVDDLNEKLPEFGDRLGEKLLDIRLPVITDFQENEFPVSNMIEETFPRLTDLINNTAVLPCNIELYDEDKLSEPWISEMKIQVDESPISKNEVGMEECCTCKISGCDEYFFSRTPWGSTLDQATVGILRAISLFAPNLFNRLAIQPIEDQVNEEDETGLRATIRKCIDILRRQILGPTIIESVLQLVEGINYITTTIYGPNETYESSSCCQKRRKHYNEGIA